MLVTVASELRMVIVMSAIRIGVIRMKNKEKYAKEIVEIVCSEHSIAVNKITGKPEKCLSLSCTECLFSIDDGSCNSSKKRREWAESECIEKPVISKRDRTFLEYISTRINYITRDMDGGLFIYISKPHKLIDCWESSECESDKSLKFFKLDFPMVKWSDFEPWLIEDLKKLEVVENY